MAVVTKSQRAAQRAWNQVTERRNQRKFAKSAGEYQSFAQQFPTLVHTCGLVQSLAFAASKGHTDYVDDLAAVVDSPSDKLLKDSREQTVAAYMRLTRDVTTAATWLKTAAECVLEDKPKSAGTEREEKQA